MDNASTVSAPRARQARKKYAIVAALILTVLVVNALVSYAIVSQHTPGAVSFDMKQTVDAFFDSASQKKLSEAQTKALSNRFNAALEGSLQAYQQRHRVLILVTPAVVQGAPDITREIQRDIARRMREEGRE